MKLRSGSSSDEEAITNIGDVELKVYSLYGPGEHPHGTVHATEADSDADDHHH